MTSAAIQGRVMQPDGNPIVGAIVYVTNTSNGQRWLLNASTAGVYAIENVEVGGPYVVEARAVGHKALRLTIAALALGQRHIADFVLEQAPVELDPVTVAGTANPLTNSGRAGPAQLIPDSAVARLPNVARDIVTLALLSPYVSLRPLGGISIGAQNPAFNRFQIDGGENGEVYLGREPGGASSNALAPQVLPRTISLESVRELQVLVAPFDVRHGSFAGGVINVVTKSGTNTAHGSAFAYFENQTLTAPPTARATAEDFTTWQFGGTLAGPIVRDRLHYLLSADLQRRVVPDPGPLITDTAGGADLQRIGISYASAARFDSILTETYGLDAGTLGPSEGRVEAADLFGKLTLHPSTNSRLELSHHYAHGNRDGFVQRQSRTYRLSSNAEEDVSVQNASRLLWTTVLGGRHANELLLSYLRLHDPCRPNGDLPIIQVSAGGLLTAGPNQVCPTADIAQELLELTDNLSINRGAHLITLGTHAELLHFRDPLLLNSAGRWVFDNLDSLASGQAGRYEIGLPGPARRVVDFPVWQLGVYAQDRWMASALLAVTGGLRLDVPFLPDAALTNPTLKASLGIDTGRLPSGGALWSPRFAFSYDLRGDGSTVIRSGIGVFSGRPPYRWVGNAYRDDGIQELQLMCLGADVPHFDPVNQPTSCRLGAGPMPRTSFFDPDLKFPQNLRLSWGIDRRLRGGWVGTVELLYTRAVHEWYWKDANLASPSDTASGEGGRPLYGTIDSGGIAHPLRRDSTAFGPVIRVMNRSGGRTASFSVGLQKQFHNGTAFSAAYAYARAEDRMSPVGVNAVANLAGTPLDGTLEDRHPRRSFFDIPHRVSASAMVRLPYQVQLSLVYSGGSGTPFTYVVDGDVNADGMGARPFTNDIIYLPRDRADISIDGNGPAVGVGTTLQQDSVYDLLANYIAQEPCLREQHGRILARNSCRNGWLGFVNLRLAKTVSLPAQRSLEIAADVFNFLNLLSSRWGRYRATMDGISVTGATLRLLELGGYDAANGRGVYRVSLPARNKVVDAASRWRVQLGARYRF